MAATLPRMRKRSDSGNGGFIEGAHGDIKARDLQAEMKSKHQVHPSVVEAAKRVYAECFSPDGKPAHRKLARQMEATMERVLGVSKLHNDRQELTREWTRWLEEQVVTLDRIFPSVTVIRRIK